MSSDLIEHFELDAQVHDGYTLHTEYVSDSARGLRKTKLEKKWYRKDHIGTGGFGDVWLEIRRENNKVIETRAVKEIQKRRLESCRVDYKREILAFAKLYRYQELFVIFHGWYQDHKNVYLAMEYFPHGDLEAYVSRGITEDSARSICKQLVDGLSQMHSLGFAHRDLKPQNIFVVSPGPQWWVKIGDFGISKRVGLETTALRTEIGTRYFQAPEILGYVEGSEEDSEYTHVVDMWSLGCVMYFILTQAAPFIRPRSLNDYCSGRAQFPVDKLLDEGITMEGLDFIKELLNPYPARRLDIKNASLHAWLQPLPQVNHKASRIPKLAYPASTPEHFPNKRRTEPITNMSGGLAALHSISVLQDPVTHGDGSSKPFDHLKGVLTAECDNENVDVPTTILPSPLHQRTRFSGFNVNQFGHFEAILSHVEIMVISNDDVLIATVSSNGNKLGNAINIWNIFTGNILVTFDAFNVTEIKFSPDSNTVAMVSERQRKRNKYQAVTLMSIATGKPIPPFTGFFRGAFCAAYSPDGKTIAIGSGVPAIFTYDVATGKQIQRIVIAGLRCLNVSFSPNGRILALSSDKRLILWDIEKAQQLQNLEFPKTAIRDSISRQLFKTVYVFKEDTTQHIVFSSDGDKVATYEKNVIMIWQVATGSWISETKDEDSKEILSMAFLADGSGLLSSYRDGTVVLWDVVTGKKLQERRLGKPPEVYVAVSPSGTVGASTDGHGPLKLWKFDLLKRS